jgi:predicted acyltransferase
LDPNDVHLYVKTLQAIGAGYVISAFILTNFKWKGQILATLLLLIIYWVPMTFYGDWTPTGNFAYKVDQLIMGRFCGDPEYTWIWSSLTFGVTVMLGAFAGQIMKNGKSDRFKTSLILLIVGVVLTVASLVWSIQMPIIKHIWTCSMTLFAGGISFLLMALFYFVVDCLGWSKGLNWLKIYGMNSIVAYMIGEYVNFRSVVESVSYGLKQYLGDAGYKAWLTFGGCLIVFLILRWMYKQRIFIKV